MYEFFSKMKDLLDLRHLLWQMNPSWRFECLFLGMLCEYHSVRFGLSAERARPEDRALDRWEKTSSSWGRLLCQTNLL